MGFAIGVFFFFFYKIVSWLVVDRKEIIEDEDGLKEEKQFRKIPSPNGFKFGFDKLRD